MSREIKFRAWDKAHRKMTYKVNLYSMGRDHMRRAQLDSKSFMNDIGLNCEIMQGIGVLDKNGKGIYEGDVLRWFTVDIEYQTHYGDNIPLGSYTEPCGVICKKFEKTVFFRDTMFTCVPASDAEEEPVSLDCPLHQPYTYDRKALNYIFYPRPYGRENEVLSDEEFLDVCRSIADELGFESSSIADFISKINGFEVIGNIYENPELISTL